MVGGGACTQVTPGEYGFDFTPTGPGERATAAEDTFDATSLAGPISASWGGTDGRQTESGTGSPGSSGDSSGSQAGSDTSAQSTGPATGGDATVCGDGRLGGAEQCDDEGLQDGDGCSASCTIEIGYECKWEPSTCAATCGDELRVGLEECDDGNIVAADGCSRQCQIEQGFECSGIPSACLATCGDGLVIAIEECDDGDLAGGDGCSASCTLEPGFVCSGQPTWCRAIDVISRSVAGDVSIDDNDYNGALGSMDCIDVFFATAQTVFRVDAIELAVSHGFVGDLVAKVRSPAGTVITLFSRPGLVESADNGSGCCGDSADLRSDFPIRFFDGAPDNPELMGNTLGSSTADVCQDDGRCDYFTDPGAAVPGDLATFEGEGAGGTWRVCIGDAANDHDGTFVRATISLQAF
jgi:cysteine-rich repeat protein